MNMVFIPIISIQRSLRQDLTHYKGMMSGCLLPSQHILKFVHGSFMEVFSHYPTFPGQASFKRSRWFCYVLVTLLINLLKSGSVTLSSRNESDRLALLAFKSQLVDPMGALSSWNDSLHHCEWQGITCGRRHRDRVTILDLEAQKLDGILSPFIGNLTFLRRLNLTENHFHGKIPQEVGRLFRLQILFLNNNSFNGVIPTNLTRCFNLRVINLIDNELTGNILAELSHLRKLQIIGMGDNYITGNIPPSLGNLSSLTQLSLTSSNLQGSIPENLCQISHLQYFIVFENQLTGEVPSCLYNNSNLKYFSVTENNLEGHLPPNIGLTLPNIQFLALAANKFRGIIPVSLSNATKLEVFALTTNHFTGSVPTDLGRLSGLQSVTLGENQLGTRDGDDLIFITSLTNCSKLKVLDFPRNLLVGQIPYSISNLSTTINWLNFGRNNIYGSIPIGIENLVNLQTLSLSENKLTGNIPATVGNLNRLIYLYMEQNMLSGQVPIALGNLTQLTRLDLSVNNLTGSIPPTLGNCQNLQHLALSQNNLFGTIPKEVIGLSSLAIVLNLSENALTGSLPPQVGNLTNLQELSVAGNKLSGHIPESLGHCLNLKSLYLSNNNFEGDIPKSWSALRGLEKFDLSWNNLSGEIPEYLEKFPLSNLNLSFNQLEGRVPTKGIFASANATAISLGGNKNLCGGIVELELPPCSQKGIQKKKKTSFPVEVIVPIIVGSICLLLLSCSFLVRWRRTKAKKESSSKATSFEKLYKRISYGELLKATNGFSVDNLIGVGSYGSVFKGVIQYMNKTVAIKVLNLQREGASKSFLTESKALRNLRHRNLLKIITACSSVDFQGNDFRALVFEYMPNGSLEEWIHPKIDEHQLQPRYLSFKQRLNIVIDVASALDYLHHYSKPVIVHCDIKPSNVLLDDDMTAHVADFGIAKMFSIAGDDSSERQISSFAVKGSIGYVAPEYGVGSEVSLQGDVYSYGILLLEMFTGKKPTDDMFLNGLSLHNYVDKNLPNQVMEIVDPLLLVQEKDAVLNIAGESNRQDRLHKCLSLALVLGVACATHSPVERLKMNEVLVQLNRIREHHEGVRSL